MQQKFIGTLVPMSALFSSKNSQHDIGTFAAGFIFLDWLKQTKQSVWQILPLNQTKLEPDSGVKHVPSPYNGYGIGLDPKYLPTSFAKIAPTEKEKKDFIATNYEWIQDYAFFCALRDHFKTDDWRKWENDVRSRDAKVLAVWQKKLAKKIDLHITVQWQLHQSYTKLRNKAKALGIALNGDLPFYVCIQSPLVWAHQTVFDLQSDGSMRFVSGVPNIPPSFFGRQVWGHPLYNWNAKERWEEIIAFWQMRLRYSSGLFDLIRFDHARAFYEYGSMDVENEQNDSFRKGPGGKIFEELVTFGKRCGLSIFVEDDSVDRIKEMKDSLDNLQSPSIKIFRFALNEKLDHIVTTYADIPQYPINAVAYTTTHDTETLLGYLHNLTPEQKQRLSTASGVQYNPIDIVFAKDIRDAILKSPARMVIIPIQDWLLTTERINVPGTELTVNDPNWSFRLPVPIEDLPTQII